MPGLSFNLARLLTKSSLLFGRLERDPELPECALEEMKASKSASLAIFGLALAPWFYAGAQLADSAGRPVLPYPTYSYADAEQNYPRHIVDPNLPGNLRVLDNTPANNPVTNAGATLGRVIFYDKRLSRNMTVSCGSCHLQSRGFTDPARFSTGVHGGMTSRNSMGLGMARYYPNGRFFWDERAPTLEAQVLMPIQDALEMDMTLPEVVARLQQTSFYGKLFTDAFGSPTINSDRIARAMAQFVRSMVNSKSKFDSAFNANGQPNFQGTLTQEEFLGLRLFQPVPGLPNISRGCNACHVAVGQVSTQARNNGLDLNTPGGGRFKSPSLRNIAVTGPYMHDGRFSTLRQVIDFYNSGVQDNPFLDPLLRDQQGRPRRLNQTETEKQALEAFLRTLTDQSYLTDAKFSNPFVSSGTDRGQIH